MTYSQFMHSSVASMELSDLAIFKAVVEEGGIIAAAERLHRVPSSVSARIRQLERSAGVQLFYRERQRLRITPKGEQLLPYAERLLGLAAEAKSAVCGSSPEGVLRLGSLESTAASRLPELLARFHACCPRVRVDLTTGTNDAMTAAVLRRELHAAFVADKPSASVLASAPAFQERLVVISPRRVAAIHHARDAAGLGLVAFPHGCTYRRILERWLGRKWTLTTPVFELSSYHAIVACVASGAGIALVPESVLDSLETRSIARHALPRVFASHVTQLVWRRNEPLPSLAALRDALRNG
jgi:DNA-binding transcriptional LysR family regulator